MAVSGDERARARARGRKGKPRSRRGISINESRLSARFRGAKRYGLSIGRRRPAMGSVFGVMTQYVFQCGFRPGTVYRMESPNVQCALRALTAVLRFDALERGGGLAKA